MVPPKMKRQEIKWNLSHFPVFQKTYLPCLQSKLSVFSEVPSSQCLPGDCVYVQAPHLKRYRLRKQLFTIKLIIICQQHSELRNSVFTEESAARPRCSSECACTDITHLVWEGSFKVFKAVTVSVKLLSHTPLIFFS